ncbi:MerR family transcriptional regulator [Parvibaculaceae bacterium PLY_AMNH_Bact1]|nr:MerR family transcriptional regulator [Parvibaculaceae bacterium PLY_AMNH_Bact1]
MANEREEYSVGQLAALTGVSVRTLHHYDAIDLLKPAHVAANGYRIYGRPETFRLQEILFYRDIGMPLAEIKEVLDGPADAVVRLTVHLDRLCREAGHTAQVIETLNATIAHLKGERGMTTDELYKPFTEEQQTANEAWLVETYGETMADQIATSKHAIKKLPQGMEGALEELKTIEQDLVAAYEDGTTETSDTLHTLLERHRHFVATMWGQPCSAEGFSGLADMYLSHPDFVARYEKLSLKFSVWLTAAMKAHAKHLGFEA